MKGMSTLDALGNTLLVPIIQFVYFLNEKLYALILTIGDINLFSDGRFQELNNRIFIFAGIFMLFKMAISVINYVLDPDKLVNSQSGAQKMIMKLLIAIAMLTAYDTIFTQAMRLQQIVLEEGVLTKIVFGGTCNDETLNDDEKKQITSNYISYTMMAPFIYYQDAAFEADPELKDGCDNPDHPTPFIKAMGNMDICNPSTDTTTNLYDNEDKCYLAIWEEDTEKTNIIGQSYGGAQGVQEVYRQSFEKALSEYNLYDAWVLVAEMKKNGKTVFVSSIFTPLLAIVISIILFIICIRVAVRSIKLAFLRLMAPVPIISYVDIKGGDKGLFSKWLKTTVNTYLELFIQLLALYFAIFIISQFVASGNLTGFSGKVYSWETNPLLNILMIVACFMFALQLPKLIQDMTGLDTSGIAKITDKVGKSVPSVAGAAASGALGLATGAVTGAIAGGVHAYKFNKDGRYDGHGGLWKAAAGFGNVVLGGFVGGGLNAGISSIKNGFNNNKSGITPGNVLKSVGTGLKDAKDQRNANWALQHKVKLDADGHVMFDASGKVIHESTNKVGFLGSLFEQTLGPASDLMGIDRPVQEAFKDEIKAYDNEERHLSMEAQKLKTNYDANMELLGKHNANLTAKTAERDSHRVNFNAASNKIATGGRIYTSTSSNDGSIAFNFREFGDYSSGLEVKLSEADFDSGDYGIKLGDGSTSYDFGSMSYNDYMSLCSSLSISGMSQAQFDTIQNDYRAQISAAAAERTAVRTNDSEITAINSSIASTNATAHSIGNAMTENSNKLNEVQKAREKAKKAQENVKKVVK